jgi:hypothetical protein
MLERPVIVRLRPAKIEVMDSTTTGKRGRQRQVPESTLVDVVARRVIGESIRTISTATGVPRSTVADLLKAPDIAAMVKSEIAIEHRRAGDRERKQRQVERDHRASVGAPQTPHTARRDGKTIAEQRRSGSSSADGRILGVGRGALNGDGPFEFISFKRDPESPSYSQWLGMERAPLPSDTDVRIEYTGIHGPGTFAFPVLDKSEHERRALFLQDEGIGTNLTLHEMISTISRFRPGSHVRLSYEDEPTDAADEQEAAA